MLLFLLVNSVVLGQHPINPCNVTWSAPALPKGIFIPHAPEYSCMVSKFAVPPDFNATWPCAAVGFQQVPLPAASMVPVSRSAASEAT